MIDDEMDLINEDNLLSEEDLKKPQFPLVGDYEVESTRKACKNCSCGRAEQEEKVKKARNHYGSVGMWQFFLDCNLILVSHAPSNSWPPIILWQLYSMGEASEDSCHFLNV
ncbi:anamorsin [Tanacetum coccineum]